MLKVVICGTRNKEPVEVLTRILSVLPKDTLVIAGAARGVDRAAAAMARARGFKVVEFPADWDRLGKVAGILRNQQMLDQMPDLVVAVHDDPGLGKGTRDMVERSRRAGVLVCIFRC